MSRSTVLVLVVLGAALAGFAFSSAVQRARDDGASAGTSVAAGPQIAVLDWRETFGPTGQQLVFEVERLEVLREGWRIDLALENDTSVAYELGDPRATLDRAFGLRLFATGDIAELERRSREGTLPAIRAATTYDPPLPEVLEPHTSWEGTISAPGSLVAGSFARVVFGALFAVGLTPDELPPDLVWTTDHAYRLRR